MQNPQKNPSLFSSFLSSLGDAIADIRQKVVEEPWFGKAVTDTPPSASHESHYAKYGLSHSFNEYRNSKDLNINIQINQQDKGRDIGE